MVRGKNQGAERLAERRAEKTMGHDAESAQLTLTNGSGGKRHSLRFQCPTATFQRTRQRYPRSVEYLRRVQIFRAVSKKPAKGQVRRNNLLQPAGTRHHTGT